MIRMIIDDSLIFNLLQDLRKKDIDPLVRAKFLADYCRYRKISQRELAKELDIPHSTLQDWVSYTNITKTEYDTLLSKGYRKKEIYRMVRDDRKNVHKTINKSLSTPEIDIVLSRVITDLRPFIYNPDYRDNTVFLLQELKNVLNRIELHIERGK